MLVETNNLPVVFLSFNEPNFLENLDQLKSHFPNVFHVNGIYGSDAAHKAAVHAVKQQHPTVERIIIVDGDNFIAEDFFNFTCEIKSEYDLQNHVLSFSAINSVNGNNYGNGGIKIWPVKLIENMNTHENGKDESIDFDLSVYLEFNKVGSTTVINSSEKQAWISGFREGFKLTHNVKFSQINWRNYDRLWRWMHLGADVPNGMWAMYGARLGCLYALENFNPKHIKDHQWLAFKFEELHATYKNYLADEVGRIGHLIKLKTNDTKIKNVLSPDESRIYKAEIKPATRSEEQFLTNANKKSYEAVFISYFEKNAEINLSKVKQLLPEVKIVSGVQGIHNAHIAAAKLCETDYLWVIDADADLVDGFNFECDIKFNEVPAVRVWRSINPINGLIYGNGGVKLIPRLETLRMNTTSTDMTTSISSVYIPVPVISNITMFNTDPFNTWKSAFRECAKLSSKVIDNQLSDDSEERLNIWCSMGRDQLFGEYSINGAKLGRMYGSQNKNNHAKLALINDFSWLKEQYDKFY